MLEKRLIVVINVGVCGGDSGVVPVTWWWWGGAHPSNSQLIHVSHRSHTSQFLCSPRASFSEPNGLFTNLGAKLLMQTRRSLWVNSACLAVNITLYCISFKYTTLLLRPLLPVILW